MQRHTADALPDVVLLELFKYLNYVELVNASKVCMRWNSLASSDGVWKNLCEFYWIVAELPSECKTWKGTFEKFYKAYGQYIDCYRHVKEAWNKLEKWLMEYSPECYDSLNEGIDEKVLDDFEHHEHLTLPKDLRLSYLIHNGQDSNGRFGLLGGQCVMVKPQNNVKYVFSNFMLSFEEAVIISAPGDTAVIQLSQSGFSPQELFDYYQIVNPPSHAIKRKAKIVTCHTRHLAEIVLGNAKAYEVGECFMQWFKNYVDKLTSGQYLIEDGKVLAYDAVTEVFAVTENITVSVRWAPIPVDFSDKNAFAYYIRMEMASSAPAEQSCKLVGRHWKIKDDDDSLETVEGSGVVGCYPVMTPGAKFAWQSWTAFRNSGSMSGHFIMHRLNNADLTINIQCPEFKMFNPWKQYDGL